MDETRITIPLAEYKEMSNRAARAEEKIAAVARILNGAEYPTVKEIQFILGIPEEASEVKKDAVL